MSSHQNPEGSTRIVAGKTPKPQNSAAKRKRALGIGIAAGLVALIAGGAVVALNLNSGTQSQPAAAVAAAPAAELKLGFFGNVTHAPALVGVKEGFIAESLGGTKLSTQVFNAGPAAIEALNAGAIDAT
jgi:NitT/TauT family transport system substrate-binding protein